MIAPEQPYCCPEYISLTYQLEYAYVLIVYSHLSLTQWWFKGEKGKLFAKAQFFSKVVKSGQVVQ